MRREEPYQGLTCALSRPKGRVRKGARTDAAWLSSARAVRCWVKSRNERNPCGQLDVSGQTAAINAEEGGDDVKSAWLLRPGLHTRYNGRDNGLAKPRGGANPPKPAPSSDRRLNPACVQAEVLVTAGQHTSVNMFPGLVHTARHVMGVGNT